VGIVILVRTKHGTIQIELSDSNANIEVKVDGDTIDIAGLGQPLRLKPGEHDILVQGKDFETASRSFTVKEGDNPVLQIKLVPRSLPGASPVPAATTPPETSKPPERIAVATEPPKKAPVVATNSEKPVPDAQWFNGHWYRFYAEQLTWKTAKRRCEELKGHLVTIDSIEQNRFVANLVAQTGWQDAWIGATDEAQEGRWLWTNGQPLGYTNWYTGQPNNKENEEHYALMSNRSFGSNALNWQWSDQPDKSDQHQPGFICEWDSGTPGSSVAGGPTESTTTPKSEPPLAGASPARHATREVILFDGKDLSAWMHSDGQPAKWTVEKGYFEVAEGGNLLTREKFAGDHQIHIEFWIPKKGQKRVNSGVFVQGRYEIQILDSYGVSPLTKQDCGALYGQAAPLLNACKPPGTWQTMEITFQAPKLDGRGNVVAKPHVTVVLNDKTVLDSIEIEKVSVGAINSAIDKPGPLMLQDQGSPVHFRNVWVKSGGG
jgi:hypothetical protein